jgi:hypothetical protein
MGKQCVRESDIARVAGSLAAACESGDRLVLEAAVREAAHELGGPPHGSSLKSELRELLLGIVERLGGLLSVGQVSANQEDSRQRRQREVCRDLLRHAQAAAAMTVSSGPRI